MQHLEFLAVSDMFLTETASIADVVFPACSFAEKTGTYTNSERRVQLVRQAISPLGESRSDGDLLIALASRMGYPMTHDSPAEVMEEIALLTPIYGGIYYDRLEENHGLQWPCCDRSHPGTPYLHKYSFSRGKGHFVPAVIPASVSNSPTTNIPLTLITGRLYHHFHTGSMSRKSPQLAREGGDARLGNQPGRRRKAPHPPRRYGPPRLPPRRHHPGRRNHRSGRRRAWSSPLSPLPRHRSMPSPSGPGTRWPRYRNSRSAPSGWKRRRPHDGSIHSQKRPSRSHSLGRLAKEYRIVAPTRNRYGDTLFTELDATGYAASRSRQPAPDLGQVFFAAPARDPLLLYRGRAGQLRIYRPKTAVRPTVFFGLRSCDLSAILYMDVIFQSAGDPYYLRRRQDAILISLGCNTPFANCFCLATKNGPFLEFGFDLQFTDLGDSYFVEAGRSRGTGLIRQWRHVFPAGQQGDLPGPVSDLSGVARQVRPERPG